MAVLPTRARILAHAPVVADGRTQGRAGRRARPLQVRGPAGRAVAFATFARRGIVAMGSAEKARDEAVGTVRDRLRPREQVVAILPFASTPERPRGPEGKTREGIYQSYRRYRPLVLIDRRLFVLDAGRTPHPRRGVLAEFPVSDVEVVEVIPGRFNQNRVLLDLAGVGTVPFEVGGYEVDDLARLREALDRS